MPPREKDALFPGKVGLIGRWIDQGAEMPGGNKAAPLTSGHWSFQPLAREDRHEPVDAEPACLEQKIPDSPSQVDANECPRPNFPIK